MRVVILLSHRTDGNRPELVQLHQHFAIRSEKVIILYFTVVHGHLVDTGER